MRAIGSINRGMNAGTIRWTFAVDVLGWQGTGMTFNLICGIIVSAVDN